MDFLDNLVANRLGGLSFLRIIKNFINLKKAINIYSTMKSHEDSGQFRAIQLAGAYALDNANEFVKKYR